MHVVIAIDSFKGSLSSLQAGNAVKDAVLKLNNSSTATVLPIADGGEGTVDAMCTLDGAKKVTVNVMGPLQEHVTAEYCILSDNTAVIEIAAAAGITLVPTNLRNPLNTTTYGVGEIINDAIRRGCKSFIIGLGGSATNDGGVGMLSALGFEFLDKNGQPIEHGAKGLQTLKTISTKNVNSKLYECTFKVACDVTNTLCGPNGCSAVFGPQKGANEESIQNMDLWLKNYALLASDVTNKTDAYMVAGTGAAGGLGFAFSAFLNAKLESGIKIILEQINLESYIKNADLVITGEGRLDSQTVMGKAPFGVAQLAKKYGKKIIAFAGCVTDEATICNEHGIDAYFPIIPGVVTLEQALNTNNAYRNLTNTAYQALRLINLKF